jgi:SAM-dependent methyltransferase
MPGLNTNIHLDMLGSHVNRSLPRRLLRAFLQKDVYGTGWGDPDVAEPLMFVRDRYLLPYVNVQHTALEIGPGGGRWTRYMLRFERVYAVDYYSELITNLRETLKQPNIITIRNNGTDFPGVPDASVDFVFSFGTFVHLDPPLIESYLQNLGRILKLTANVVIQYSDKTKIMARENPGFAENTPETMRHMVQEAGFRIVEEDLTTLWHSSIIRFTKAEKGR